MTEDETHDDLTSRYMYDGTQWVWQYTLNNTKFTQAQIDAINSGITSALVSQITDNQNNIGDLSSLTTTAKTSLVSAVNELQSGKQATISDLATIRAGASAGASALQPNNNITELNNDAGYTSNVGTVTSVNNVEPDANGNVTISTGVTYTAGTGIDITNNEISVTSPTLVNTATAQSALTLLGNANTNYGSSVNIGNGSTAGSLTSVAIGYNAHIDVGSGGGAIAIGQNSHIWGQSSNYSCIAIGASAEAQYCTYGLALGVYSFVGSNYATAIGYYARAQHQYAIQLGQGTNSEAKTLYVGFNNTNYKLLDGTTGKIPIDRIDLTQIPGYDSSVSQTLKHTANGSIEWVND